MAYEKIEQLVSEHINNTLARCWFGRSTDEINKLEKKGIIYTGKVRDSFPLDEGKRAIVVADTISAFDQVADRLIPFKGQILNQISNYWFDKTIAFAPNHLIKSPHPNISIVFQCNPLPIEMIVRGYLTGSGWRDYEAGNFEKKYGIKLPQGLEKHQQLDEPILTPTTKAPRGQKDKPITNSEAIELVGSQSIYNQICEMSLKMYEFGMLEMKKNDCIFVDTKYEFGMSSGGLLRLIDEINTSDSSRFWRASTYNELWQTKQGPESFDKEILRGWIIEQGYDPESNMPLPTLTDEIVKKLSMGYVINFENITGGLPKPISEDSMAEIEEILLENGLVIPKR